MEAIKGQANAKFDAGQNGQGATSTGPEQDVAAALISPTEQETTVANESVVMTSEQAETTSPMPITQQQIDEVEHLIDLYYEENDEHETMQADDAQYVDERPIPPSGYAAVTMFQQISQASGNVVAIRSEVHRVQPRAVLSMARASSTGQATPPLPPFGDRCPVRLSRSNGLVGRTEFYVRRPQAQVIVICPNCNGRHPLY